MLAAHGLAAAIHLESNAKSELGTHADRRQGANAYSRFWAQHHPTVAELQERYLLKLG